MIPGLTPFATHPFSDLPAGLDRSTPDPFRVLQDRIDSSAELVFLVTIRAFDPNARRDLQVLPPPLATVPISAGPGLRVAGADVEVRLSNKGFVAEPTPGQLVDYPARLKGALSLQQRLFDGEEPAGQGSGGVGEIDVINTDGEFDFLLDYAVDGREIEILAGAEDFTIDEFGLVFKGTIENMVWDERRLTLQLRDPREFFTQSVQLKAYLGVGGLEGPATLRGRPKPLSYGRLVNVPPVLIDAQKLIYGLHDGRIQAIDAVRDNGVPLVFEGDTTDILETTVTAAHYKTDLSNGVLRLGAAPAGLVTADLRGDVTDGVYTETTAGILRRIATKRLGVNSLQDPLDLETGSFAALGAIQPAPVGLFIDQDQDAASAMNALMGGIGGFWTFCRDGLLKPGRLESPTDPVFDLDPSNVAALERVASPAPSWRRRVGYRRSWAVQGDDSLAETVDAAARELYARPLRFAERAVTSTLGTHRLARDVVTEAFFDQESDANAEAERLTALQGVPRDIYRATLPTQSFRLNLGDVVRLTWPRFGLEQGRAFVIIGLRGDLLADTAELELWG